MASYDVEEILESRKKGGKVEYLVRWAPTWEAERNLSCSKLLKEFKASKSAENGQDDDDDDESESEEEANTSKRATPRKAAKAANKKRKAAQKSTGKRTKRRR